MIAFTCPHCRVAYRVAPDRAGRRGRCKRCGGELVVPSPAAPAANERIVITFPNAPAPPTRAGRGWPPASDEDLPLAIPVSGGPVAGLAPSARLPMRTRRLLADIEQIRQAFQAFPLIALHSMEGTPPDVYRIEYRVRGLARGAGGQLVYQDRHLVEIQLTSEYPRQSPKCKMLTPVFHPNIDPVAICVGDHWTAGERLIDLVIRIGEMISYQAYNLKSPLDGEAAMWADVNKEHLPIDPRDLHPPNLV